MKKGSPTAVSKINQMLTNGKRSKEAFGLSHETEPDDFDDDDDAYDDNIELAVAVKEVNKNKMKH